MSLHQIQHAFLAAETECTLIEFRLDLAAPDESLNLSQQNVFAAANLMYAPVSAKSSSVVEFVQKIEAAAL